jgi:hypothetical protein
VARSMLPWGALFIGGLGAAAVVRAVYRPKRVVIDNAFAQQCAGMTGCDPAVTLQAAGGQPVYAMAPGVIASMAPGAVTIVARDEAVVLDYSGLEQMQVGLGERVGIGQQIGLARQLRFAVYQLDRAADGSTRIGKALEPASWLSVHGLALSAGTAPGHQGLWCETGRQLSVPKHVAECGIELPQPGAWSLLPVRVSLS